MRAALIQLCSSDNPRENIEKTCTFMRQAADEGAGFVLTPEVTNFVTSDRSRLHDLAHWERDDPSLEALRDCARELQVWMLIGSLALRHDAKPDKFVNRSFLIAPDGSIRARYDKIHMFDISLGGEESYRESASYEAGETGVVVNTDFATIGMTICYDVRFPQLYRALSQAGAEILTVPSAFTVPTGKSHWESLLRARAIENGAYVLAPAQSGDHAPDDPRGRKTYGHSLAISPWGEILSDAGIKEGVTFVDLDSNQVAEARRKIPSLTHDKEFLVQKLQ